MKKKAQMGSKEIPKFRFGDRELRVLIFLWKWKLVTNAALTSKRFFPTASAPRAYRRLHDMRRAGLIEMRCDSMIRNAAWTLSQKGFKAIREYLPALKEEGFRSEHFEHDILVTAFHLGDWLFDRPNNVHLFTEQELRRCSLEEYPHWVPKTDLRRPDGYWGFSNGSQTVAVAIEVELHKKLPSAYEELAHIYAYLPNVFRVLWLVPSLSAAKGILATMLKSTTVRGKIHNFALISDFKMQGWQAPIVEGIEKGKTVQLFLSEMAGNKCDIKPTFVSSRLLLNTMRSCNNSATLSNYQLTT